MKAQTPGVSFVHSVFHPSDFSEESEHAFAHALAIALLRDVQLTVLHAGAEPLAQDEWTKFPAVRRTLERWGLLEPGSPRAALFGILQEGVKKVDVRAHKPLDAILGYLDGHATDLIVLATEGRQGLPRWLHRSVAESLARRCETLTLFVPGGVRGFVSLESGETSLRRILVPVDHQPSPHSAIQVAVRAAEALGDASVRITLLHVGSSRGMPALDLSAESPAYGFEELSREGDVVDEIVRVARDGMADLIVMATQGHDGILDALRGSVTEQVLRQVPCPLLAVPVPVRG